MGGTSPEAAIGRCLDERFEVRTEPSTSFGCFSKRPEQRSGNPVRNDGLAARSAALLSGRGGGSWHAGAPHRHCLNATTPEPCQARRAKRALTRFVPGGCPPRQGHARVTDTTCGQPLRRSSALKRRGSWVRRPGRPRPLSSAAVGGGSWHAPASAGHFPMGHDPRWLSRPKSGAGLDSHRSGGAEPPRQARLTLYGLPPESTQGPRQNNVSMIRGRPSSAAWRGRNSYFGESPKRLATSGVRNPRVPLSGGTPPRNEPCQATLRSSGLTRFGGRGIQAVAMRHSSMPRPAPRGR